MKILLDTHVWLFRLLEPERLPGGLRAVLREPGHEFHLSPISVWETLVLARKGRLRIDGDPAAWVERALAATAARMAPLTHAIAIASEGLERFPSRDPADRLLVATALTGKLVLATLDRDLIAYPGVETID